MYLDLGRWITGSALCLSGPLKRLAYSRIDLLWQRQSTSQGNMGDSELPEILYETCACIIHYCMFIIIETLHDHLKSLRDSKPPVLGTRGPRDRSHDVSVYETCACVIINLPTFNSIVCAGYMCFVKL